MPHYFQLVPHASSGCLWITTFCTEIKWSFKFFFPTEYKKTGHKPPDYETCVSHQLVHNHSGDHTSATRLSNTEPRLGPMSNHVLGQTNMDCASHRALRERRVHDNKPPSYEAMFSDKESKILYSTHLWKFFIIWHQKKVHLSGAAWSAKQSGYVYV